MKNNELCQTILVTGALYSGKSDYIQNITNHQAQIINELPDLMTVWETQSTSGERVLYVEAPFVVSRSEIMRLQMGHFTQHFHLERVDGKQEAIVYRVPTIGDLDSKVFHHGYVFQAA